MTYNVLNSLDLINLRKKLNISLLTADLLFGLKEGTYDAVEQNRRSLTLEEENLIRQTNCFDNQGCNVLPKWMYQK